MKPKQTFFQREIMPLFSSTYHSDDSDSDDGFCICISFLTIASLLTINQLHFISDDEEKRKKQRQRRDAAKKKKQEQQQLKDTIMDKARSKRNAIKLQALEG